MIEEILESSPEWWRETIANLSDLERLLRFAHYTDLVDPLGLRGAILGRYLNLARNADA